MSSSFRYRQPFVTEEDSENEMSPTPQPNDSVNVNSGNTHSAANDQRDGTTTMSDDQAAAANNSNNNNNTSNDDQPPAYEAPSAQEAPAQDAPPAPAPAPARLTIIFKNQAGAETQFKLKNTTAMAKAFDAYHATNGIARGTLRFLFEGQRVVPSNTPKELEMEDGDIVEIFTEQIGGGAGVFAL